MKGPHLGLNLEITRLQLSKQRTMELLKWHFRLDTSSFFDIFLINVEEIT